VADVTALRLDVLGLVLGVVVRDVLVADLDAGRHLLVDLVLDNARTDVVAYLLDREVLLLHLGLELLLAGRVALPALAEVLGLDRRELLVDVGIADLDAEVCRLLFELGALDEELHRLLAERDVLRRARVGPGLLVGLVVPLRLIQQPVELVLRDRLVADDGDVVRADTLALATAAGRERGERDGDGEEGDQANVLHEKRAPFAASFITLRGACRV
jgi:hypothetical protein